MTRALELVGQKFSQWTVIERSPTGPIPARVFWRCRCECGNEQILSSGTLTSKNSKSCGQCIKYPSGTFRHGHARKRNMSRTYSTWVGMRQRCSNPNGNRWAEYGGRGIKVCDRWEECFENFLADMGEKPMGMSIDRIDVNGNYEPSNCRWATKEIQARNRRPAVVPRIRKGNKLTRDSLAAIRACHKAGLSGRSIAIAFQISTSLVSMIINEKCWVNRDAA